MWLPLLHYEPGATGAKQNWLRHLALDTPFAERWRKKQVMLRCPEKRDKIPSVRPQWRRCRIIRHLKTSPISYPWRNVLKRGNPFTFWTVHTQRPIVNSNSNIPPSRLIRLIHKVQTIVCSTPENTRTQCVLLHEMWKCSAEGSQSLYGETRSNQIHSRLVTQDPMCLWTWMSCSRVCWPYMYTLWNWCHLIMVWTVARHWTTSRPWPVEVKPIKTKGKKEPVMRKFKALRLVTSNISCKDLLMNLTTDMMLIAGHLFRAAWQQDNFSLFKSEYTAKVCRPRCWLCRKLCLLNGRWGTFKPLGAGHH